MQWGKKPSRATVLLRQKVVGVLSKHSLMANSMMNLMNFLETFVSSSESGPSSCSNWTPPQGSSMHILVIRSFTSIGNCKQLRKEEITESNDEISKNSWKFITLYITLFLFVSFSLLILQYTLSTARLISLCREDAGLEPRTVVNGNAAAKAALHFIHFHRVMKEMIYRKQCNHATAGLVTEPVCIITQAQESIILDYFFVPKPRKKAELSPRCRILKALCYFYCLAVFNTRGLQIQS